ncbi:flavin-containing monooxygenase 5 [Aplysia californica]|uniref:Flavin-containing monooxygenase n=1 Tax=Aplysia californica TaxID=6500 RepID=A0ABM0ZUK6_APLCA|nr:flavin-containing monooxygenase 5 [Aplysia californica]
MDTAGTVVERDAVVIGAGISGLVTAKCLKEDGYDVIMLERSSDVGGLWTFREHDYGVMKFTHINVSKYNYCFSDYPFPDSTPDYPHHTDMARYVKDYATHFRLLELVQFNVKVVSVEQTGEKWRITACKVKDDGKAGEETDVKIVFVCSYLAVTSGHHAKPSYPKFPGEDTFPGECCRLLWGLNPKMGALQTQPTVSPTLIHHIQRRNVKIVPNITRIEGRTVHFVNGYSAEFDKILYCTGYKIDLPFLPESVKSHVLQEGSNYIKLYKNVFAPHVGSSLAFIGFVQPASGGILTMAETQARWFSALCKGKVRLPSAPEMELDIKTEKKEAESRWYQSARHTIQKDPILYCDEVAAMIGAKPDPLKNPLLAWRLLFSTCGAAQYRLTGPHSWSGAREQVLRVPVTDMWRYSSYLLIAFLLFALYYVLSTVCGIFCAFS